MSLIDRVDWIPKSERKEGIVLAMEMEWPSMFSLSAAFSRFGSISYFYQILLLDLGCSSIQFIFSASQSLPCVQGPLLNFFFESFVGRCAACALLCTDCSPPLQAIAILSVLKYRSFSFYPKSNFSNFD